MDSKKTPPFWSWALYDWANSAFTTVIITFIFSIYFKDHVAPNPETGALIWGCLLTLSGVFVIFLAPFLGFAVDKTGSARMTLIVLTCAAASFTGLLYFAVPQADIKFVILIAFFLIVANTTYELSLVLQNGLLPMISDPRKLGRVSSWAWAAGYIGGLFSLAVCFPLVKEHIKYIPVVVAVWFIIFSLPLFLMWKEEKKHDDPAQGSILDAFKKSCNAIFSNHNLRSFFIGSALIRDGMATLFAFGAIYASEAVGLNAEQLIIFGVGLNVSAALGAFIFSYVDDWLGSKTVIIVSTIGLIVFGSTLLTMASTINFILCALALGIFVGPAQASCRTLLTRMVPQNNINGMYGFYALSGKAVSVVGPFLYTALLFFTSSQNWAMTSVIITWVIGLYFIYDIQKQKS